MFTIPVMQISETDAYHSPVIIKAKGEIGQYPDYGEEWDEEDREEDQAAKRRNYVCQIRAFQRAGEGLRIEEAMGGEKCREASRKAAKEKCEKPHSKTQRPRF